MDIDIFSNADGFEWEKGNVTKIWNRHRVSISECEEVFFNMPLIVKPDVKHSVSEDRYYLLGKTDSGRQLFIVFTMRGNKIRVISARDMNKKEKI